MGPQTRNSLMFVPDADVSPHDPPPTNGQPDLKVIKHGNTRLSEQETADRSQSLSCPPSPTRSRIDAAISGTPCEYNSSVIRVYVSSPSDRQTQDPSEQFLVCP